MISKYYLTLYAVQVLFWDADTDDVCTAWVITNDPFLQQLFVEVLESLDEPPLRGVQLAADSSHPPSRHKHRARGVGRGRRFDDGRPATTQESPDAGCEGT